MTHSDWSNLVTHTAWVKCIPQDSINIVQFPECDVDVFEADFINSKIFNLTKYREVIVKYSLLITNAGMPT